MSTSQSLDALRRANPRNKPGFDEAVDAAAVEVWARIEAGAIQCQFRPKQALFRAGLPADALYFILSGRVRV